MFNRLFLKLENIFAIFQLFNRLEIFIGILTSIFGAISSIVEIFSIYLIFSLTSGRNLGLNLLNLIDTKLLLTLLLVLRIVAGYIFLRLQTYISFSPSKRIADKLFNNIFSEKYEKYRELKASDYVTQICSNSGLLPHYLILPTIVLLSEVVVFISIVAYIILFSTKVLVLGLFIISILTFLIYHYSNSKIKDVGKSREKFENERINLVIDAYNNWETLVIHKSTQGFKSEFFKISSSFQQTWIKTHYFTSLPKFYLEILVTTFLVAFYITLDFFSKNEVSIFFSAIILAVRLAPSFSRIINSVQYFNHGKIISKSIQKSFDDINIQSFRSENHIKKKSKDTLFQLKNVSYKVSDKPILENITVSIGKGMTTIVGSSGSGKSTLVRILTGILKADSGSLSLNISDLGSENVISFVPQNVKIFNGNIYQNVSMEFDENKIDKERVINSLVQSGFFPNSDNFNKDTFCSNTIGETLLSGGERQRLGIARALYQNSEIICLDEISSALDSTTESQIFKSLRNIAKNRVVISVAHRLSILVDDDNIIFMKDGRIGSQGLLEKVLGESEEFRKMYNLYFKLK